MSSFPYSDYVNIRTDVPLGTVLFTVSVTTRDQPTDLTFSLLSNVTFPFAIDPASGSVRVSKALAVNTYTIMAIAYDHGVPPFSSNNATVIVNVLLENMAPKFNGLPYVVSLIEKVIPPYPVFNFTVIDSGGGDLEGVDNVTLFLPANYSDYFSLKTILNITAGITVAQLYQLKPLVYKQTRNLTLTITAYDLNAITSKNTTTTISVSVINSNPNGPTFIDQPYTASIPEGPYSTSLAFFQVNTTDIDGNYPIVFSLVNTFGGIFQIDTWSGSVSVVKALSISNSSFYQLTVVATDTNGTGASSTASINVTVLQSYAYNPAFKTPAPPTNLTLWDSTPTDYILFNFTVTDQSPGAALSVQLVPDNTVFGVVTQQQQNGSLVGSLVVNKALSWQVCL